MWERRDRIYRYLRRNTEGDARKVIDAVRDNNGWEAWRKTNVEYELGMSNQKAQARAAIAQYMNRKANSVSESKALLIDLDKTMKRYREITGTEVDGDYV